MFSCSPLQPQIAAAASQLGSILSGAGVIRHGRVAPRRTQGSQQYALKHSKILANTKPCEQSEVQRHIEELPPFVDVCKNAQDIKKASIWKPSYASSSSFYENKTGFPESDLHRTQSGSNLLTSLQDKNVQKWLHGILLSSKPYNLYAPFLKCQQLRHFHVKHKPSSDDLESESDKAKGFQKVHDVIFSNRSTTKGSHKEDINMKELSFYKKGLQDGQSDKPTLKRMVALGVAFMCAMMIFRVLQNGEFSMNMSADVKQAEMVTTKFSDVKGAYEAKQELEEVVEFLKNPYSFTSLGAKLPKGVLLVGPPGNGKTLLARAVAGEAGVPFLFCSGSEFDEIFVGSGARKVRKVFKVAKMHAPCVVFIDEFDTVGSRRTNSPMQPYANQTINQLLAEMDGFEQNNGVIVLGATNKREILDPAVTRAGRFDVQVTVNPPDMEARKSMLQHYLSKVACSNAMNMDILAKATIGFSGADIENLVNQAALRATLDADSMVEMKHLEFALDKIRMGPAAQHKIPDKDDIRFIAEHEAGHALVAVYTKKAMPLYKVTILPRGSSGGHNSFLKEKDHNMLMKSELLAQMDVCMGGLVAEQLFKGENQFSTGPQGDLASATDIARNMVKRFGMSNEVGLRIIDDETISTDLNNKVDKAVEKLLKESYDRAKAILQDHQTEHRRLVDALLEHETINGEDVKNLVLKNMRLPKNYSDRMLTKPKKSTRMDISGGDKATM